MTLLLAALHASAQATDADAATIDPMGPAAVWVGSDVGSGKPSSLRLSAGDGADITLAFGEPYNCRVLARRSLRDDGDITLSFLQANGGRHCNALVAEAGLLQVREGNAELLLPAGVRVALSAAGQYPAPPANGQWAWAASNLRLNLRARDPGDAGSELVYGSPRNCRLALRYEGRNAQGAWFSPLPGNGGQACDRLLGHGLVVTPEGEQLRLRIEPAIDTCQPACVLQPVR